MKLRIMAFVVMLFSHGLFASGAKRSVTFDDNLRIKEYELTSPESELKRSLSSDSDESEVGFSQNWNQIAEDFANAEGVCIDSLPLSRNVMNEQPYTQNKMRKSRSCLSSVFGCLFIPSNKTKVVPINSEFQQVRKVLGPLSIREENTESTASTSITSSRLQKLQTNDPNFKNQYKLLAEEVKDPHTRNRLLIASGAFYSSARK